MAIAAAAFHLAYYVPPLTCFIGLYAFALLQLSRQPNRVQAMNTGWLLAFLVYAPHLSFFWKLFGAPAIALWLVLGFWLGLFLALLRFTRATWSATAAIWLGPFLWLGLEYFRSELYYLRFSWLSPGYAFAWSNALPWVGWLGVYGIGFILMAGATAISVLPAKRALLVGSAGLLALAAVSNLVPLPEAVRSGTSRELRVAGMQLEFPDETEVPQRLDQLHAQHPEADLYVLSEYTFQDPIPDSVKQWCRRHQKYLLAGGKEPSAGEQFYNTAFVVDPNGDVVFQQAKAQPIQFFKDGLPATQQRVWTSPWGRLGICICYDFSYARVVDELARQGAQAILVPTMDVEDWGSYQHHLHARVGPVRASEYRVPVLRLASSGVSQLVTARGEIKHTAQIPGRGEILAGTLLLDSPARRPLDRWLAWPALILTAIVGAQGFWKGLWERSAKGETMASDGPRSL